MPNYAISYIQFSKVPNHGILPHRNVGGQLFVLQVAEGHAGRGLGSLVCRAISRKVAEMGDDVWAHVFSGNERAMRLFRRIGFEIVDTNHFVEIVKNKE